MVTQRKKFDGQFKLVPPEGGWGYFVALSVFVMHLTTIVPWNAFGLLFGRFLESIGDETTGTSLTNGAFNTVQSFTGLITSFLMRKYSYRKVGLAGALFYSVGALCTIFVVDLRQLILTAGILEGIGFGLMFPAVISAINSYFRERLNLMMGLAQTLITVGSILSPPFITFLNETIGFRNTLVVLAGLTLLNFPAMGVLQPVKWHMKKVPIGISETKVGGIPLDNAPTINDVKGPAEPLIHTDMTDNKMLGPADHEEVKLLDFGLLKDPKYLNMSIGLALSFTGDLAFTSIIRMVLNNLHFDAFDITKMMMVYFTSDLVARILYSVVSYFFVLKNRYVFLLGSILSAVFRTAFIFRDDYMWKMATLAILGFLRSSIQVTLCLVISDEYKENFPTALSLFMVVTGTVSLLFGPLLSFVKDITQSDIMVIHTLTAALLICSISWSVELIYRKLTAAK